MGEQGAVVVGVGGTRLLVNQHLVDQAGDLTVFDLATGRRRSSQRSSRWRLSSRRTGADPVAPGAAVAFKFQARFPSPYDGIWLATVP